MSESVLDRYRAPITRLRQAFADDNSDRLKLLELVVIDACLQCERYLQEFPKALDDAEIWRREQTKGRSEVAKQRIAVERIARFARSHRLQAGIALAQAGFSGFAKEGEQIELAEGFARALTEYERALSRLSWTPESFLQSTHVYNMLLPKKPKRRAATLKPATGLMFRLVVIFRKYSAGHEAFGRFSWGETIPECGMPHYEIAGEFARTATGDNILSPEKSLKKFLDANPGLGLAGWPTRRGQNA